MSASSSISFSKAYCFQIISPSFSSQIQYLQFRALFSTINSGSFCSYLSVIHEIPQLICRQFCFSLFPILERSQDLRSLCFCPSCIHISFWAPQASIFPSFSLLHSSPSRTAHSPQLTHLMSLLPAHFSPLHHLPDCLRPCCLPGFPPASPRCHNGRERTSFQVWSASSTPHCIWSLIAFLATHIWLPTKSTSLKVVSRSQQGFLCF